MGGSGKQGFQVDCGLGTIASPASAPRFGRRVRVGGAKGVEAGMGVQFTLQERSALYGLLAHHSNDIILKTDSRGFVLDASPAIERLGLTVQPMLIGPHVRDLVDRAFSDEIEQEHRAAIAGRASATWLEMPAVSTAGKAQWFEVQVRPLGDPRGGIYGALVVMRCIAVRKTLEERLFVAEYTDPLTGWPTGSRSCRCSIIWSPIPGQPHWRCSTSTIS